DRFLASRPAELLSGPQTEQYSTHRPRRRQLMDLFGRLSSRNAQELEQERAARQRAEREFAEQVSRLQERAKLLDFAHEGVVIRDLAGRITYWNRGAEELYGWNRQRVLDRDKHKLLQTRFSRPYREIEEELFRTGHCEVGLEQTTANGQILTVAS